MTDASSASLVTQQNKALETRVGDSQYRAHLSTAMDDWSRDR